MHLGGECSVHQNLTFPVHPDPVRDALLAQGSARKKALEDDNTGTYG